MTSLLCFSALTSSRLRTYHKLMLPPTGLDARRLLPEDKEIKPARSCPSKERFSSVFYYNFIVSYK